MISRVIEIVFPIFIIVFAGFLYGRRYRPEIAAANRMNMLLFLPALVFTALTGKTFALNENIAYFVGALFIVAGSGLIAWPCARIFKFNTGTFVPSVMFSNVANMGLPLLLLAFGDQAIGPAIIILVTVTFVQFLFSPWIIGGQSPMATMWKEPLLIASVAGVAVSLSGVSLWPPFMTACKLLGDISIGLMIFALGIRLALTKLRDWRIGIIAALLTPLSGVAMAWLFCWIADIFTNLSRADQDILFVFGAMPPAVSNFIFAERYGREPEKVACIVALGNATAVIFIPLTLALRLQ